MTMQPCTTIAEIKAMPFFSQFTDEQIRNQVSHNANGMRKMHSKAIATGKKVGGFTAEQLDEMATRYEKMIS